MDGWTHTVIIVHTKNGRTDSHSGYSAHQKRTDGLSQWL